MSRALVGILTILLGIACRSPSEYDFIRKAGTSGPLPCVMRPCFADTLRPSPQPQPCPPPAVSTLDTTAWLEYRNEFNGLRLTLPGRFERLGGPAWRFDRLAYVGRDIDVVVFLDSLGREDGGTCVADCGRVKERARCYEEFDGRPAWIETRLVITPDHFPPLQAFYMTEVRVSIREGLDLVYQSRTRYEDVQRELLATLRRLRVPATFP